MIRKFLETIQFGFLVLLMYILPDLDCLIHFFKNRLIGFGIAVIKICQYIFPIIKYKCPNRKLLLSVLQSLGDDCHKYSIDTQKILKEEGLLDIVNSIDNFPLHSGSIAQVFKGYDKDGNKLAIKIKHNYIDDQIMDIRHFVKSFKYFFKINIDYDDFYSFLILQTDLQKEYDNLKYFYDSNPEKSKIIIPRPIYGSNKVLVMDWVDFQSFPSIENKLSRKESKYYKYILSLFYDSSILLYKKEHCDLHHGNWGVNLKEKKIVILDFGIVFDTDPKFLNCHIDWRKEDDLKKKSSINCNLLSTVFKTDLHLDLTCNDSIFKALLELLSRSEELVVTKDVFLLLSRIAFFGCINDDALMLNAQKKNIYLYLLKNNIFPELKSFYKKIIYND